MFTASTLASSQQKNPAHCLNSYFLSIQGRQLHDYTKLVNRIIQFCYVHFFLHIYSLHFAAHVYVNVQSVDQDNPMIVCCLEQTLVLSFLLTSSR